MNKHTPGTWHTGNGTQSKFTIYDKFSQRVANSFEGVMTTQRSDATCEANARLIAAAPELLESLRLISQWREVIAKSDIPAKSAILEDFDDARAAIAKATGE